MNERIKQLAEQAGGHNNISKFRGHFLPPPPDYVDPATVDLKKFAELIVRECARVADDSNQMKNRPVGVSVGDVVLKNFGVE